MKKLLRFLIHWSDRLHWLWLGLAAPFLLFPSPTRSLAMAVVPGTWLLHWVAVGRQKPDRKTGMPPVSPIPITPLNGAVFLLALMVLVSIWATYDLAVSLPKISGMVLGIGVFFGIAREGKRLPGWWLSFLVFLGAGAGIAALSLVGTNWSTSKFGFLNPILAGFPTLFTGLAGAKSGFNPNEVAGALTWVLPVLVSLSVYLLLPGRKQAASPSPGGRLVVPAGGWRLWGLRALVWLVTLFVGLVFGLTQSRSGYLGLVITLLVLFLGVLLLRWRWIFIGVAAILSLGVAVFWRQGGPQAIQGWLAGGGLNTGNGFSINSMEGRIEIWSRAIYGLQDYPFTGMGMNIFREVVPGLYPLFLAPLDVDIDVGHAHNEFLQAGLDLGIPGLVALIGVYIIAFWLLEEMGYRFYRAQGRVDRLGLALVVGLGGGLLAHLIYGLLDAVALGAKPGILFWMLLGLISALYFHTGQPHLTEAALSTKSGAQGMG